MALVAEMSLWHFSSDRFEDLKEFQFKWNLKEETTLVPDVISCLQEQITDAQCFRVNSSICVNHQGLNE